LLLEFCLLGSPDTPKTCFSFLIPESSVIGKVSSIVIPSLSHLICHSVSGSLLFVSLDILPVHQQFRLHIHL
jgi:hypothetical protein